MEKELRKCKQKTLMHITSPIIYGCVLMLLEGPNDKWYQDFMMYRMNVKEEKKKLKNHRMLCLEDSEEYTPEKLRYLTSKGDKEEVWWLYLDQEGVQKIQTDRDRVEECIAKKRQCD